MHNFEKKLLKAIFETGEGQTLKLNLRDISLDDRFDLMKYLEKGILTLNKQKNYIVSSEFKAYKGKVVRSKEKFCFVYVEELDEDIYVYKNYINDALVNDEVIVRIIPSNGEGIIEKITHHYHEKVVGRVVYGKGVRVVPLDPNIKLDILIEEGSVVPPKNSIVVCHVTDFGKEKKGIIEKVLGNKNTIGIDVLAKIYKHDVPVEFSLETLEEVNSIPNSVEVSDELLAKRLDLRDKLIYTIDGEDAKDFDDAISVEYSENGNVLLGVHIADVTHYVKEGNPIDKDAVSRGTSVYLADRVIPMLPFELSNGICSLNPDVDRLCMSCFIELDNQGEIVTYNIKPSIIHSKYRLTYTNVNKLFNGELKMDKELSENLFLAKRVATLFHRERVERGMIDLDIDEAKILIDEEGKPYDIIKRERGAAEMMIEDFMIAANEVVASYINYMGLPFIYRIHENPSNVKLESLKEFLNSLGYYFNIHNGVHPKDFQKVLESSKGENTDVVIRQMMLRSLAKAKYSEVNKGHFGLASSCYTHFTSPIRRYPDLLCHRLLKHYAKEQYVITNEGEMTSLIHTLAESSSRYERRAMELEREVERMKMAEYMLDKIGLEYEGTIVGMIDSGFFVELDNMVEGMVRFETINFDYFIFDEASMSCYGRSSKIRLKLGSRVKVEVFNVDVKNGKIEFLVKNLEFKKKTETKVKKYKK